MKKSALAVILGGLLVSSVAMAHSAGDILLRVGAVNVTANSSSHSITNPEVKLKVKNNTQLGLTGTYFFTDNIATELLAATPFTHKIYGNVPILGVNSDLGAVAKVKHLPPSLYLQYYFGNKESAVRPYIGAGFNYTRFFSPKSLHPAVTNLQVKKHSVGPVINAGIDVKLTEQFSFNAALWYTNIRTKANFNALGLNHEVKIKLDPLVAFAGFAIRF